jgi:hypothetical protein
MAEMETVEISLNTQPAQIDIISAFFASIALNSGRKYSP